jgi:hypothetical protein
MTDTTASLHAAREYAEQAWWLFLRETPGVPDASVDGWQKSITPAGDPILSGQVIGQSAVEALRRFTSDFYVVLKRSGDQRPAFDYSTPNRVTCVWRTHGVWIELWHPDTAVDTPKAAEPAHDAPAPVQATPAPKPAAPVRSFISRASDRLPFTRNRRKETPAA